MAMSGVCLQCRSPISPRANSCPQCGARIGARRRGPIRAPASAKRSTAPLWIGLSIAVMAVLVVVAWVSGYSQQSRQMDTQRQKKEQDQRRQNESRPARDE